MYNFLEKFDGTDRAPRDIQIEALNWLAANWNNTNVFVLNMPVGTGKSAVARAIQLRTGGHIITPSNILVKQYRELYPDVNYLIGKSHYLCKMGISCQDWVNTLKQKPCDNCTYMCNKQKFRDENEPTFFNPLSLYFNNHDDKIKSDVLIVDEAHQLEGMLLDMCGSSLKRKEHPFTDQCLNELFLIKFLKTRIIAIKRLIDQKKQSEDFAAVSHLDNEYQKLTLTIKGLEEDAHNYAIWIEDTRIYGKKERVLHIKPLNVPKTVSKRVLNGKKVVMMSGTISGLDVISLMGAETNYKYMELESPIPKENRLVYYRPIAGKMNRDTDPKLIVEAIEAVIKENPGLNCMIHVPYSMSKKLVKHFTIPIIYNESSADKQAVLDEFKAKGGVLLAAGMGEGVDLPGDLCRLNIIPKLFFPDLSDESVKKRLAREGGERWYVLEAFKKLIQQIGRSTRGADDFSKTYILDSGFAYRFNKYRQFLPKYFTEAIVWSKT